mgnify:CR=1 FL=1
MTKGMKESAVLDQCLVYLKAKGLYVWRNNTGAVRVGRRFIRFGYVGSSDILGITKDGRFLAVECKREKGGVLSDAQKEFIAEINRNGGVAVCVHSVMELVQKLAENNVA